MSLSKLSEESKQFLTRVSQEISLEDLNRLFQNKWLNDKLINFFIVLLNSHTFIEIANNFYPTALQHSSYFIFNSFFCCNILNLEPAYRQYRKFKQASSSQIETDWNILEVKKMFSKKLQEMHDKMRYLHARKKENIAEFNLLFVPFIQNNHWSLFIVKNFKSYYEEILKYTQTRLKAKHKSTFPEFSPKIKLEFIFMDSLFDSRQSTSVLFDLFRYTFNSMLIGLLNHDLGLQLGLNTKLLSTKNTIFRSILVPNQSNYVDCGICMLENIEQAIINNDHFLECNNNNKSNFYSARIFSWKREKLLKMTMLMQQDHSLPVD